MKNLILEQPDLKDSLIEHSKNLFRLNNGIIQECENKNIELIKLVGLFILSSAAFLGFIKMISTKWASKSLSAEKRLCRPRNGHSGTVVLKR